MRIALWRYGLPLQTDDQSTVGGGMLSRAVIGTLLEQGHRVDIVGPVAQGFEMRHPNLQRVPRLKIAGYGAAVILTGVYNPLYGDAAYDTYRRLASFEGTVAYCQWDVALPFHFDAMLADKPSQIAGVKQEDVHRNKRWMVLTQTSAEDLRSKGGKTVGYQRVQFEHVPCLFELEELRREAHPPQRTLKVQPRLAYFGSDRPGRMTELRRWFAGAESVPVDLYGRWSDASRAEFVGAALAHKGMVREGVVPQLLNGYAATMYMADAAYVKTDFIAQRFFENVTAGVPVLYSDKLQPSVAAAIPRKLICSNQQELTGKLQEICAYTTKQRNRAVEEHAAIVRGFAAGRTDTIQHALEQL